MPKLNVARSYSLVNLISFYRFQASRVVSTMARPNLVTFCQSYAVFTARRYTLRPSVRLSLCLTQVGVPLKRQNIGSHKQHHTIAQDSRSLTPKMSAKFDRSHPLRDVKCRWGGSQSATFDNSLAISRKRYTIAAWLLLKSNRKSYALNRMVTLPATLRSL